jgi:hypothetical protein
MEVHASSLCCTGVVLAAPSNEPLWSDINDNTRYYQFLVRTLGLQYSVSIANMRKLSISSTPLWTVIFSVLSSRHIHLSSVELCNAL